MILEVCVDSLDSAKAAESGGAGRIELCSALSEGGITPSTGLLSVVREAVKIPVFVMIRPRGGDFFYTADEFRIMRRDIEETKKHGADGVVLGLLYKDGHIDVERTQELVQLARPMGVTFHRAIDWTPDMEEALEHVIASGADRILTSGGMATAMQAAGKVAGMIARAHERIRVMVCGRVRKDNVTEIARLTGASEFHSSLRRKTVSPVTYQNTGLHLGDAGVDEFARYGVLAEDVRALRDAMQASEPLRPN